MNNESSDEGFKGEAVFCGIDMGGGFYFFATVKDEEINVGAIAPYGKGECSGQVDSDGSFNVTIDNGGINGMGVSGTVSSDCSEVSFSISWPFSGPVGGWKGKSTPGLKRFQDCPSWASK